MVRRSFSHKLSEAYIDNHNDEDGCVGLDAPDAYGYSDVLKSIIEGKEDTLSNGLLAVSDYTSEDFNGSQGDLGFTKVIRQSHLNFADWRNNEELDLIVIFLTGRDDREEIRILAEDRIPLTTNAITATPTPPEFIEEDPTPTPTPFVTHDLSSWMVFDPVQMTLLDNEVEELTLNNVTVDNLSMPDFLGRPSGFEILSYIIVKRSYDGSFATAYEGSSELVYGNSSDFVSEDGNLLATFEDFYNLQSGNLGKYKINNFDDNPTIIRANYENTFVDWKGEDEVDLLVGFGSYDFITGENKFHIEDRFPINIAPENIQTPTPTPEPTPTPNGPRYWNRRKYSNTSSTRRRCFLLDER